MCAMIAKLRMRSAFMRRRIYRRDGAAAWKRGFAALHALETQLEQARVSRARGLEDEHELAAAPAEDAVLFVSAVPRPALPIRLAGVHAVGERVVEEELGRELEAGIRVGGRAHLEVDVDRASLIPARIYAREPGQALCIRGLPAPEELPAPGVEERVRHVRVHAERVALPDVHDRANQGNAGVLGDAGHAERELERRARAHLAGGRIRADVGALEHAVYEVRAGRHLGPRHAAR